MALLNDSPERVIGLLCSELRSNLDYLESVLFLDVSSRLARLILHLQRHLAIAGEERPSIRFSQKEIANLLGCSREWVGKELGKWRDAGLIDLRRRHLVVRNRSALDRLGA